MAQTNTQTAQDTQLLNLRVPPHSIEAEQSVLGGLLLDNQAFDKIADVVSPEDFYRDEHRRIPHEFRYAAVPGLSTEVVQRLDQVKPETIGQAMRVPGVTPAAITVLSTYVSRQ